MGRGGLNITLRDLRRLKSRAQLLGVVDEYSALVNKGGMALRCKSQITKQCELRFRVVLTEGAPDLQLVLV
jgi:hypothetical protein